MFLKKLRGGFKPKDFDVKQSADPELAGLVSEVCAPRTKYDWGRSTLADYEKTDAGKALLRKDPDWNRRGLLAVFEQADHWAAERDRLLETAKNDSQRMNLHHMPGGSVVMSRYGSLLMVASLIAKRKLPLTDEDLVGLIMRIRPGMRWQGTAEGVVVKQVEFAVKARPLAQEVRAALVQLSERILQVNQYSDGKVQARINKLLAEKSDSGTVEAEAAPVIPPPVTWPAAAGHGNVLVDLKRHLGVITADQIEAVETRVVEPDAFVLRAGSPLAEEHAFLGDYYRSVIGTRDYHRQVLKATSQGRAIIKMDPVKRGQLLLAASERAASALLATHHSADEAAYAVWQSHYAAIGLIGPLAHLEIELERDGWFDVLLLASAVHSSGLTLLDTAFDELEKVLVDHPLTPGERHVLHRYRCQMILQPPLGVCPPRVARVCRIMGEPEGYWLVPGEHWADQVHRDMAGMSAGTLRAWQEVLGYAAGASTAKPSSKWAKAGRECVRALGSDAFVKQCEAWLASVSAGRSIRVLGYYSGDTRGAADTFNEGNATIMRGLVWMLALHPAPSVPRVMGELLLTSVKKVPGVGPRAVKVANACVWALGELAACEDQTVRDGALGQLARLKAKVTFKTTLNAIDKALDKAADAAGVSREEIEELGVPDYGFDNGRLSQELGGASVELVVEGNKVSTRWTNDKGKPVKSPPAAVKRDFQEEVKEFKQFAKDAEGILMAGRERLDTLFLKKKSWPLADWRERYLDHGLLGTIARRLIWLVDEVPVMFNGETATNLRGDTVPLNDSMKVELWHPIGRPHEEVLSWRRVVEDSEITQPFKQAHREVYLLTEAELSTGVYSNRFAAHVIKQHQFNALCGARRWRNRLRLMVDDVYPPATLELPAWQLRAEFWVEGIGDNYGADTTESGTYLYLSTDQVRFYAINSADNTAHAGGGGYTWSRWRGDVEPEPIPLDQIPPLVLSEVMRDVDLFVGVASVGNDPTWEDGGPEGRHVDYWHSFSFGDLSATAQTRRDTLEKLIPRLKIADRCTFDDRFLVVKGELRTYKIHMGSGNILMEPNDQYLCIVPGSGVVKGEAGTVFLPFEGDRTLSIILSKAFMLADDKKIKDRTIITQIKTGR